MTSHRQNWLSSEANFEFAETHHNQCQCKGVDNGASLLEHMQKLYVT